MVFNFKELEIPGVKLIEPAVFGDERGFFMETYNKIDFINNGIDDIFSQDNHSSSSKYVLRGLHYQLPPFVQSKIVRCVKGGIFDVAVDIRNGSPTFGKYVSAYLDENNKFMLYIPDGFAHGFLSLTDNVEVMYKASSVYNKGFDRGIAWNDCDLNIQWPSCHKDFILSTKDAKLPKLKDAEVFDYKDYIGGRK